MDSACRDFSATCRARCAMAAWLVSLALLLLVPPAASMRVAEEGDVGEAEEEPLVAVAVAEAGLVLDVEVAALAWLRRLGDRSNALGSLFVSCTDTSAHVFLSPDTTKSRCLRWTAGSCSMAMAWLRNCLPHSAPDTPLPPALPPLLRDGVNQRRKAPVDGGRMMVMKWPLLTPPELASVAVVVPPKSPSVAKDTLRMNSAHISRWPCTSSLTLCAVLRALSALISRMKVCLSSMWRPMPSGMAMDSMMASLCSTLVLVMNT
mmetsp:Transcript_7433/g.27296  ORF Transcript_7433/g.27296 Transcript_7433/m.27296 type:complete len:262 (+) Transcript_7433:616-1401(+)